MSVVDLQLEQLVVRKMASGDLSLLLTDRVDWETFPDYANAVLRVLGGTVVERADSPVERVWTVSIGGALFWLAHDEVGVSLDSKSTASSSFISSIQQTLLRHRSGT